MIHKIHTYVEVVIHHGSDEILFILYRSNESLIFIHFKEKTEFGLETLPCIYYETNTLEYQNILIKI